MEYEIERKWLLKKLPDLSKVKFKKYQIEQCYLENGVRLRKANESYFITLKSSGTQKRAEWETPIPKWAYDELKKDSTVNLTKTRYSINYDGYKIEIDEYKSVLKGLITVEAEWIANSENYKHKLRESREFILPEWLEAGKEVTGIKKYSNINLAKFGLAK